MHNINRIINFWLIILPNLAIFYVALCLTIMWRYPEGLEAEKLTAHYVHFTFVYLLWLLTFLSFHLFERETFRRYTTLFFSLVSATVINLLLAIGYFYFQPELILTPRRFLLVHIGLTFGLVLLWDILIKHYINRLFVQPVYLFSFNPELRYLEQEIKSHNYLGFKVQGHLTEQELRDLPGRSNAVVIFPDNLHADTSLANTIFELRNHGIKFYNHNYFYEKLLRRIYLPSLDQIWFLQNVIYTRKIFYTLIKTIYSYVVGLMMFIIFAVTFPIFGLLIMLTSTGPILFKQSRVGEKGRVFNIYKYRTMKIGQNDQNTWTAPRDQRITGLGKFMRLLRIDEWPQSMNLLLRDMSLVGPRPEQVGIVERLRQEIPFYDERHIVKPGITGWAQLNVYAGSLEETKIKLEYDLYYIKNQSILFDLEIILKTIYNIIRLQGR